MMPTQSKHLYESILFDVSNLYHMGFETSRHLKTRLSDGSYLTTGGIVTTLKMISRICRENIVPRGQVFYLCDSSWSGSREPSSSQPVSIRRIIDPTYKQDRSPHPDPSFYRGLELTIAILEIYRDRSFIVQMQGYEADDLVPAVLERYQKPQDRVLLVSTDDDWCRMLSDKVDVLRRGELMTAESFQEKRGYSPVGEGVKMYKAFRGDSDNIPKGVLSIREKDLLHLMADFPNLDALIKGLPGVDYLSDEWKKRITESWPRVMMNYQLVNFLPVDTDELAASMIPCFFHPRSLRAFYDSLGIDASLTDPRVAGDDYARGEPSTGTKLPGKFFIRRKIKRI